jgi:hypothetical protein
MQNECKWALKECKIPVSLYFPLLPAKGFLEIASATKAAELLNLSSN